MAEPSPPDQPSSHSAYASVESPLQLLTCVEAHAAGLLGEVTVAHARPDALGMRATARALTELGLPPGLRIVVGSRRTETGRAHHWGVGDAFSGAVQRALVSGPRGRRVTLLDDGMATLAALEILATGSRSLVRPATRGSAPRIWLGHLARRRLLALAAHGELVAATTLPVPGDLEHAFADRGGRLARTDFAWLRSTPRPPAAEPSTVLLGSAMATDGLIAGEPYLRWVAGHARAGRVRYLAHRRESAALLDRVAGIDGVTVDRDPVPAELRLRSVRPGQQVVSLPSTALLTLRLTLADQGAVISGHPVPESWWLPRASPALRAHLQSALEVGAR